MRILRDAVEHGRPAGNHYDKYNTRNPVARRLVRGFGESLFALAAQTGARAAHEVGCGEGYWTLRLRAAGYDARGSDVSAQAVAAAVENAGGAAGLFSVASLYELDPARDGAELVVCCEVLEHVDEPERGVAKLAELARPWCLASVPREPLWRLLNLARGRYWRRGGNTPGHVQHWPARAFVALMARHFEVVAVRKPLPWTMCLCRRRGITR